MQDGENEYKGLSTDTKPTNCAVNSLFLELDTGDFYASKIEVIPS